MKEQCDICDAFVSRFQKVLISEVITSIQAKDSFCHEKEIICCESCIQDLNFRSLKEEKLLLIKHLDSIEQQLKQIADQLSLHNSEED